MIETAFADLLPQRRALMDATGSLRAVVRDDLRRLVPVARGVLNALALDPLTAVPRAGLAITALPWQELARAFEAMAATGQLGPDVLAACVADLCAVTDGAALAQLETALATQGDDRLRRLALAALVASASLAEGWNEDRLRRLRDYRQDQSPLVAAAAQFTFPPEEGQA